MHAGPRTRREGIAARPQGGKRSKNGGEIDQRGDRLQANQGEQAAKEAKKKGKRGTFRVTQGFETDSRGVFKKKTMRGGKGLKEFISR